MKRKEYKSLVIGFCRCASCGWDNNKFNWHTYFQCPECGSNKYTKEGIYGEQKTIPGRMFDLDNDNSSFDTCISIGR